MIQYRTMITHPQSGTHINDYLHPSDAINSHHPDVKQTALALTKNTGTTTEKAKLLYDFVRDRISHSFDIRNAEMTCIASDVLQQGHGICFAKSHLLAALCRAAGIPAGLCYQRLRFDDEDETKGFTLHGLNAVYLSDLKKWIRLDARGNKPGVSAQFSTETEYLAFPIRPELGEKDYPVIYTHPDPAITPCLVGTGQWKFGAVEKQLPGVLLNE